MADMSATIKNGIAVAAAPVQISRNADGVYTGRKFPFFSAAQNRIAAIYGQYADNCYDAQLQGYDPDDFYRFWPVQIRCEDVSREATGTNLSDDVKGMVVYYPEGVNYVPLGAHVTFASSTWIVTNPANISSILTESIIRRCNVVYRRLDFYGNVLECPFSLSKVMPRGAQDDYTKNMILADHYFTATMQLNDVSAEIHENTRMILGDAAYSVRGLDNFTHEFTGDFDSTHIMYFQIQREEKLGVYDDMERKIADGLAFSWEISLTGNIAMRTGQTQTITPVSVKNGIAVENTAENPIGYLWESSDTSVLDVDENGAVTAVGSGTATIRCKLAQNTEIHKNMDITVSSASGLYVAFCGAMPDRVKEQETVQITAAVYMDGEETEESVRLSFSGPPSYAYTADVYGNSAEITCWERSDTPLTVTASYGNESAEHEIILEAWN